MSLIKTPAKKATPKNVFVFEINLEHGDADFETKESLTINNETIAECYMRFWDNFNVYDFNYINYANAIEKCLKYLEKYSLTKFGLSLSEYFNKKYKNEFSKEDLLDYIHDDILTDHSFVFYDPRDAVDDLSEVSYECFYYDENGVKFKVKLGEEEF